jgi:hypothetical protein
MTLVAAASSSAQDIRRNSMTMKPEIRAKELPSKNLETSLGAQKNFRTQERIFLPKTLQNRWFAVSKIEAKG